MQGAFISLWRNHRGRFFTGSVRAYLFGAVAKASLKHMEEEQRYFFVDLESVTDSLIDELTAESDSDRERILGRLHRAIDALPDRARQVLRLIIFQGLSYREVASQLDISPHTVRNHYAYALSQLRKKLGGKWMLWLLLMG